MLNGRTFNATGLQFDQNRPVFKLDINYTKLDKFLRFVFRRLSQWLSPTWIQPVLLLLGPRLLLPETVILKQRVEKNWKTMTAFDNEEKTYTMYQHLQGSLMPYCYGKAFCGTTPALIFSQARGKALLELTSEERVQALPAIQEGYEKLSEVGLVHGDPRLDHVFYDRESKRVMFIDFDLAMPEEGVRASRFTNDGEWYDLQNELLESVNGH